MELSQSEKIQILRKRVGMNQGALGEKAFATSFESGRTKVKNIELGRQIPTPDDLRRIAETLGVNEAMLDATRDLKGETGSIGEKGTLVLQKTLDLFPGLSVYIEMLNKAVKVDDSELIRYIADKIAMLLKKSPKMKVVRS